MEIIDLFLNFLNRSGLCICLLPSLSIVLIYCFLFFEALMILFRRFFFFESFHFKKFSINSAYDLVWVSRFRSVDVIFSDFFLIFFKNLILWFWERLLKNFLRFDCFKSFSFLAIRRSLKLWVFFKNLCFLKCKFELRTNVFFEIKFLTYLYFCFFL